ncbi:MAG: protein kinase [Planctomycetota bacterium]
MVQQLGNCNLMMKLATGEVVRGYRVDEFLGRGGFASCYRAIEEETGETVALKVGHPSGGGRQVTRLLEVTSRRTPEGISPDELPGEAVFLGSDRARIDLFDDQEVRDLLAAEARTLAQVDSSQVVRLRGTFLDEERPFLVLDMVRGQTLRQKIRDLHGIHLNWFLSVVRSLIELKESEALDFHGDLKPENLIVKPSGKVVMLDPALRTNEHGAITTTPHYNPLLLQDSKADVTAIGIMIYEILTGTLPFDEVPWEFAGLPRGGETTRLSLSFFYSYTPPQVMNPKTPPELERMVYRCITVPDYGLEELREDLEDFIGRA